MFGSRRKSRFSLCSPGIYTIKCVGHVDDKWSCRFGLTIEHTFIGDGVSVTELRGEVIDQAALFGILNGLYGLGFPLLSVDCESSA